MDEFKQGPTAGAAAEPVAPNPEPTQGAAKKPGVQDVNGDGKIDFKDYVATAAKAVGGAYSEAADAIKEKAPEFAEKAKQAANEVKDAFVETAETVKAKTPEYVQKAKSAAENVKEAFEDAFGHKAPQAPANDAAAPVPPTTGDTTPKA